MVSTPLPSGSFYGRSAELGTVKRLIERRVGAQIGFRGIGGIGKSTLLAQIAAVARQMDVTPYIVSIALDEQMTPVGFYRKLLDGLRATGKTTQRRALILSEDMLRPFEMQLQHLEQQEIQLKKKAKKARTVLPIFNGDVTGKVVTELCMCMHRLETTARMFNVRKAFADLITCHLPETVTMPASDTGCRPGRLLILLVDNVERSRPDVLEELCNLRSGRLRERVLLICAGRAEERSTNKYVPCLLTHDLERLDDASCHAWLSRSAVTDQALREAILRLCQGVPLLLRLCLHEVEQARAQGETLDATNFELPPQSGGEAGLHAAEEFLVDRFIERLERSGPQGKRLSRLVRFGCVLPDFADCDAIRALQIDEATNDLAPLIRALGERGILSGAEIHPVIRQAALTRMKQREPQRFRDLCERAGAYYTSKGRLVDVMTIRLQAGEAIVDEEFAQQVRTIAQDGEPTLAQQLVAVVERFVPQRAELAWMAALARVDLAQATGKREEAEEEMVRAVALAEEQPKRVAALEKRVRTLEQERPLQNRILLRWWKPRRLYSPDMLQQLLELGRVFHEARQYAAAAELLQQSLAIAQRLGDRQAESFTLWSLGAARLQQGEEQEAQEYLQQALDIYRDMGDRQGVADTLPLLGGALLMQGKAQEAQGYFQQALDIYQDMGNRLGIPYALMGLGHALQLQGEGQVAQTYYQRAMDIYRDMGERGGVAHALLGLGKVLQQHGEGQTSRAYYQQALAIYQDISDQEGETLALLHLGEAQQ